MRWQEGGLGSEHGRIRFGDQGPLTIVAHRNSVPAIVLGRGYTGLGALRALAQAGITTYVACPADDLAARSCWYRPLPGKTPWNGDIDASAPEHLQALPFQHAVLIPCGDDAALWTAGIATSELATRFRSSSSPRETLAILQDKHRFAAYLGDTDLPHPRTFAIESRDDIANIPFDRLDRVFLKPVDSQRFNREFGLKGIWTTGRREFEEQWSRLDAQGFRSVAQEYVPGGSDDHYFVDGFRNRHGTFNGLFCRRRLRIFPPDFGNSSCSRSIPPQEVAGAIDGLTTLLSRLHYRGIFSAEFKRDARNGEFKLLEVNTRAWWYVEFAARCGINVCRMAWEDAQDLPVTPATAGYRLGANCVNLHGDVCSVLSQPRPLRRLLSAAMTQWPRAYFHVFRIRDPWPGVSLLLHNAGHALRKLGVRARLMRTAPAR